MFTMYFYLFWTLIIVYWISFSILDFYESLWLLFSRPFQKPCQRMNCLTLGHNSDCWNQIETGWSPLTISKWFFTTSLIKSFMQWYYLYVWWSEVFLHLCVWRAQAVLEDCHFHMHNLLSCFVHICVDMVVFFLFWRVLVCYCSHHVLYFRLINLHDSVTQFQTNFAGSCTSCDWCHEGVKGYWYHKHGEALFLYALENIFRVLDLICQYIFQIISWLCIFQNFPTAFASLFASSYMYSFKIWP